MICVVTKRRRADCPILEWGVTGSLSAATIRLSGLRGGHVLPVCGFPDQFGPCGDRYLIRPKSGLRMVAERRRRCRHAV